MTPRTRVRSSVRQTTEYGRILEEGQPLGGHRIDSDGLRPLLATTTPPPFFEQNHEVHPTATEGTL